MTPRSFGGDPAPPPPDPEPDDADEVHAARLAGFRRLIADALAAPTLTVYPPAADDPED